MKKNLILVLTLATALLGLSACNDLSSPESTLASAATAAGKNNLKALRETLASGSGVRANGLLNSEFLKDVVFH